MATINITIPAYNEEVILQTNVLKLADFCNKHLTDNWFIVIVNNNSSDATAEIGKKTAEQNPTKIKLLNLKQNGKGLAIAAGWQNFPADYYIFMDADLATDLQSLPILINELKKETDLVIGSRRLPNSQVEKSWKRKIFSWGYANLAKFLLNLNLKDFACGFKGVNQKIKQQIVPQIKNQEWFWDTELLYLSHQKGFLIQEIPVRWTEIPDKKRGNRLNVFSVTWKYLRAILKLRISR